MKYLTNLDLNQNELQNAVIQPLAAAPSNPKLGQIYYNSVRKAVYQFDGADWKEVGSEYTLPTATEENLGGVKSGESIKVEEDGKLSYNIQTFIAERVGTQTDNEVIEAALSNKTPNDGDIFVIKTKISGEKFSYSSFVYDSGNWVAMDGNVDATNVIMRNDIVTAGAYSQVGNITKSQSGTGSIAAAGKSIADVLTAIFTKELNPSKVEPSVSLTISNSGAKEVGTVVTPSWSAKLNPGSYTYGPGTGIVAAAWNVVNQADESSTDATGSFNQVTIEDSTHYVINAIATYGDGAIPVTNIGNPYADAQIKAGTKSSTVSAFTGFRSYFYGSKDEKSEELDSAYIRAMTNANKAISNGSFKMNVTEGSYRVIIAFPTAALKKLVKVEDANAFGTDIVSSFVKQSVEVEGANGYQAVPYDVWVYESGKPLSEDSYTVTIG